MSKRFIGLEWRLVLVAALAFAAALTVFIATQNIGTLVVDEYLNDEAFWQNSENKLYEWMQRQITRKKLASTDAQEITELVRSGGIYVMYLIRDGCVIFDSLEQIAGSPSEDMFSQSQTRALNFADGTADAVIYSDPTWGYYMLVYTLSWMTAALAFILVFTLLIRRRLRYILTLEQEMRVLEGGDLYHDIEISGGDELTRLAGSINEMRLSVLERQEAQERAEAAGRSLVASMSHDLRTPLTALIGYLELIKAGKFDSPQQREHFETSALEKVYRIKGMTDDLFKYALGELDGRDDRRAEAIQMDLFLEQIASEEQFDLERAGLELVCTQNGSGFVLADPQSLLRVFDNLFSNARRYASAQKPVELSWKCENGVFRIDMISAIRFGASKGTGIGLSSSETILKQMGGTIDVFRKNGAFNITIRLPLCEDKP